MKRSVVLALLLVLSLGACAETAVTTWPYSSWYQEGGTGVPSVFETQRGTCLSQLGVADVTSIQPGSPQETQFIECMNAAGWCTELWACSKPGA